jgi:NAD(P)H-hydrate epimerase
MATSITPDRVHALLPERPTIGHKGTFGHVFVIAGSRGLSGAVKLAVEGALRSGAGLVTAGVPEPLADIAATSLLEGMTYMLPANTGESLSHTAVTPALEFARDKSAVVLGPGLSKHPETRRFVLEFVPNCPVPLVIDADGLNCLSADPTVLTSAASPCLLTPHPGEMARLTKRTTAEVQATREAMTTLFARSHSCTVALKGKNTVVSDPLGGTYVNPTGNAGMATAGTGDVLAGLLGGLLAQGMKAIDAALLGVYLHGLAGDLAAEARTERGMISRDLLEAVPEAWKHIEAGG